MTSLIRSSTATLCLALAAVASLSAQLPARTAHRRPAPEAREQVIPAAEVPAAVKDAFAHAYPYATAVQYSTVQRSGGAIYKVSSRAGTVHRVVVLDPNGTIVQTETQIPAAQLPAAVKTAAQANGAQVRSATLVVAGQDTTYAVTLRGRRGELKFAPDGKPVAPTHQ